MTKQEFISIVAKSKNQQDVITSMGRKYCGYTRRLLNNICEKYGVDISHLKHRRSKIITKKCKECEKEFLSRDAKKASNFCSKFCARKYSHRFVNIEKLKKTMQKKARLGILVPWNKGKETGIRRECVCSLCNKVFYQTGYEMKSNKICVCSDECRVVYLPIHQSEQVKRQYQDGRRVYGGTTKWYTYKNIKVQGTYELRACKILDKMLELKKINSWKYSPCRIKYTGVDGKLHTYLIDFGVESVTDDSYFVETKGFIRENDELKWAAARAEGKTLHVWFNSELTKLEQEYNLQSGAVV